MKKEYSIKGMHCNGCKTRVENIISNIEGVVEVQVNLQDEKAMIYSDREIELAIFQTALPDSFTITTI